MNICNPLRKLCAWRSGAKQVSIDAVIPLCTIPVLIFIAAQTIYFTIITFLVTPILVYHLHHNFLRFLPRSKFFLMWTITSVIVLILVFEWIVVPLLEILPEENFFFISCVISGIFCAHKTRINAGGSTQNDTTNQDMELGESANELCVTCRKRPPSRAYHCRTCQTCILDREYHCKWLDCCIGSENLRWYLGCLLCSTLAFIYGSNLTVTTVCHPFRFLGITLLPDDCSDVYHQIDLALCFVSAIYSMILGLIVLCYLIYHIYLIYIGTTANERRNSPADIQCRNGPFSCIAQLMSCKY